MPLFPERPVSPLVLPSAFTSSMPRSRSPTSVIQYPTMSEPRSWWVINRGRQSIIVDLYATRNHMYDIYRRYQMTTATHTVIQAFLDEMRFACEPNLRRWTAVPRIAGFTDPLMAEDWLWAYGTRQDFIDLTDETIFEDDVEPETQLFADDSSVAAEIDRFFDNLHDDDVTN